MDQFVVSARKYRPATFNSVVGQSSITTTLKNAIRSKHLAQAFLFCGPRGVGKTTCARILAKTINCTNLTADTEGCNECESCISFNNGQSLNIFELDAASNNSVDDMRNLVEQVRYAPQSGNFKIYIIDEVHMLSAAAFNAFLKTLEEPPPYAVFILATTEKHKIIPTILSRCQIFDFNRITIEDIASHLQYVATNENINAEKEALHLIAQKADGALRDALSIFDQIVSFAGETVTYKNVIDNLNILDYEYYFRLTDFLLAGDFPSSLMLIDELTRDGFDVHHFVTGLSSHFRDLLVCKDPQTIALLETGEKTREKYKAQSKQCPAELLFRYLEISNKCDIEFKASQNQRLHTELAILKMCALKETAFQNYGGIHPATAEKIHKQEAVKAATEKISDKITPKETEAEVAKPNAENKKGPTPVAVPAPAPIHPQQSVPRSRNESNSTISISKKLNPQKTDEPVSEKITEEKEERNAFTQSDVIVALKNFIDKVQQEGRKQLGASLNKHTPLLKENFIIEIPVDNAIQAADIKASRVELLGYMKTQLKNNAIQIQSRVVEEKELKDTAYTPTEKYNKMVEKNPDLNQLRQQFDLDLDS
jgi:DNA polymerase III subunit gamma/tau